jgi:hypothetical protein
LLVGLKKFGKYWSTKGSEFEVRLQNNEYLKSRDLKQGFIGFIGPKQIKIKSSVFLCG